MRRQTELHIQISRILTIGVMGGSRLHLLDHLFSKLQKIERRNLQVGMSCLTGHCGQFLYSAHPTIREIGYLRARQLYVNKVSPYRLQNLNWPNTRNVAVLLYCYQVFPKSAELLVSHILWSAFTAQWYLLGTPSLSCEPRTYQLGSVYS